MYSMPKCYVSLLIGVQELADLALAPQHELRKLHALNIAKYSFHSVWCSGQKNNPEPRGVRFGVIPNAVLSDKLLSLF